jgi:hypothetical protein
MLVPCGYYKNSRNGYQGTLWMAPNRTSNARTSAMATAQVSREMPCGAVAEDFVALAKMLLLVRRPHPQMSGTVTA